MSPSFDTVTDREPEAAKSPFHAPVATQLSAPLEDQVRVLVCPTATEDGLAESVVVRVPGFTTVRVTDLDADAAPFEQDSV